MGSADIIPGVSGGTMALIVGIYNRLLHAIKSVNARVFKYALTFKWKKVFEVFHWKFLLPLLSGIIGAFLFFTRVIPLQVYMFTNPEVVFGLFFGLIAGSIYILVKALDRFTWREGAAVLAGVLIGFWVVTRVPADTPETIWFVFLSGALAICAMILPGISGSYILLILRKYDYILMSFSKLGTPDTLGSLTVLVPFIIGAAVGLMLFSRLLSWLLDNFYTVTLSVLIGFLIGSLYIIWPFQHRSYHTVVAKTKVVSVQDPQVQSLREEPENTDLPEYHKLGDIVNPGAPAAQQKIEVLRIKRKLVQSQPFLPGRSVPLDQVNFWGGLGGILVGFVLVGGLEKLRT